MLEIRKVGNNLLAEWTYKAWPDSAINFKTAYECFESECAKKGYYLVGDITLDQQLPLLPGMKMSCVMRANVKRKVCRGYLNGEKLQERGSVFDVVKFRP